MSESTAASPPGGAHAAPENDKVVTQPRVHSTWVAAIRTGALATLAVTLVMLAFVWPTYNSKPKDLPVTVSGPQQATAAVTKQLEQSGVFTVKHVADRDAAVDSIKKRDSYGGFVAGPKGLEVLTSSAASSVASQTLTQVASGIRTEMLQKAVATKSAATPVTTTDVVPLGNGDKRGTMLVVAGLPLTMGGMIGGVLISLLVVGHWRRLTAIAVYGVLGGLALTLVLNTWFGTLQGSFMGEWLTIGLSVMATAAVIVGLNGLIGAPGIGIGAVLTLFIGNPLSSMNSPVEFLPWQWGTIGQSFVAGATGSLLRLESYFPEASTMRYWVALLCWLGAGVLLTVFGRFRDRNTLHLTSDVEPDEPRHGKHAAV